MSLQTGNVIKETGTPWEAEGDTPNRRESEKGISSNANLPKCSICQSTFRRPEHLRRHFRSHTNEKPFECTQCGRHFSRTDTLHRHELSHHTIGAEGGKDHTHRITVKTFRACFNCATARVRCSGGMPCGRCDNRSLECKYPTARRSKAKTRREASQKALVAKARDAYCQDPQATVAGMNKSDPHPAQDGGKSPSRRPSSQMTQFQVPLNGLNTSNVSPQSCTDLRSRESAEEQSQESQVFQRSTDTGKQNSHTRNVNKFENVKQMPISPYTRLTHQACPSMSTSGKQGPLTTEPSAGINDQFGNFHSEMANSNSNFGMSTNGIQQAQMGFCQPVLDTSMQSMNWLPSDLFSGTANNSQTLSEFSSQSSLDPVGFLDELAPTPWLAVVNGEHISPSLTGNASQTPSGIISLDKGIESPNQFTQAISDGSSHSSPRDPTFRSGDSYVDGACEHLPKYSRKQRVSSKPSCSTGNSSQLKKDLKPVFGFRLTEEIIADCLPESNFRYQIQRSTYTKIHSMFFKLCCTENFIYQKFESEEFPTAETLANFIYCYFDSFQPVYPILHPPTFDPNECHWLVTLAISAIGCHVAGIPETEPNTVAFHEFLRRAINIEKEKLQSNRTPLWLLQAMLLNCVGLLYGDSEQTKHSAFSSFADLCGLSSHEKLLGRSDKSKAMLNAPLEQKWIIWIEDEARRRTGYCIWLFDCTVAYHFDRRPLLTLDDVQAALPSEESLWQANSSKTWKCLLDKPLASARISLYDAVHMIYIEKKLATGISEFSYILLIHALYHRMWEVGDSFRRPISFWNPTAKKQSRETAIPSGSVWLPGIPSYSKWRNSSCDCLDILHWTANNTVAQAAGLEHPTVVHLHVSRLVLLTPFREIRSLVTSLALGKIRWPEHKRTIDWHYIWHWVKHDQYKARLAITHAGAMLWHVQRCSTNAFHEPGAAFLAVLTLWAYGYCSGQMKQAANPHAEPDSDQSFIHLDRPCEDELAQIFVRKGQTMKGIITGVGDICGPGGPEKILRIGCELLAGLTSWGISKRFIAILTSLAELVARNSMTASSSHDLDGMAMDLCK